MKKSEAISKTGKIGKEVVKVGANIVRKTNKAIILESFYSIFIFFLEFILKNLVRIIHIIRKNYTQVFVTIPGYIKMLNKIPYA